MRPDDLAAALAPPPTTAPATTDPHTAAAQLRIAAAALGVAEELYAGVPAGRHLDAALAHLVRTAQAAYAGMQPALVPADADTPIPYTLATPHLPAQATQAPLTAEVWRWGVQTSPALHPLSRLVGLVLAECAQPSGWIAPGAQPTLHQLTARTGLGMQGLHHHLTDLVDRGWVTRERTRSGSTTTSTFQLRLPDTPTEA
jgi:hypothetical protein